MTIKSDDSNLKSTLKDLETAFQEWDKLEIAPEADPHAQNHLIKERAKNILHKLKAQIEELSE